MPPAGRGEEGGVSGTASPRERRRSRSSPAPAMVCCVLRGGTGNRRGQRGENRRGQRREIERKEEGSGEFGRAGGNFWREIEIICSII
jgi:hypothetical protein